MLDRIRQRETLDSFDYQWRRLGNGDAMLSDPPMGGILSRFSPVREVSIQER